MENLPAYHQERRLERGGPWNEQSEGSLGKGGFYRRRGRDGNGSEESSAMETREEDRRGIQCMFPLWCFPLSPPPVFFLFSETEGTQSLNIESGVHLFKVRAGQNKCYISSKFL